MVDTSRNAAVGSVVTAVKDNRDELIIELNTGTTLRHRKRPLPETDNAISFLGIELLRHKNLPWPEAHQIAPPKGTELGRRCVGFDIYAAIADGKWDYTEILIERNAESCGYIKYPTRGDVLSYRCVGFDYTASIADGLGGSNDSVVEKNSQSHCNYVPPVAEGTELSRRCIGFDLYHTIADGRGGSSEVLLERNNSGTCGYIPTAPVPAEGTELSRKCIGFDLYKVVADGRGGSYNVFLEKNNSATCGYVNNTIDFSSMPKSLYSKVPGGGGFLGNESTGLQMGLSMASVWINFDGTWGTSESTAAWEASQKKGRFLPPGMTCEGFESMSTGFRYFVDGVDYSGLAGASGAVLDKWTPCTNTIVGWPEPDSVLPLEISFCNSGWFKDPVIGIPWNTPIKSAKKVITFSIRKISDHTVAGSITITMDTPGA